MTRVFVVIVVIVPLSALTQKIARDFVLLIVATLYYIVKRKHLQLFSKKSSAPLRGAERNYPGSVLESLYAVLDLFQVSGNLLLHYGPGGRNGLVVRCRNE